MAAFQPLKLTVTEIGGCPAGTLPGGSPPAGGRAAAGNSRTETPAWVDPIPIDVLSEGYEPAADPNLVVCDAGEMAPAQAEEHDGNRPAADPAGVVPRPFIECLLTGLENETGRRLTVSHGRGFRFELAALSLTGQQEGYAALTVRDDAGKVVLQAEAGSGQTVTADTPLPAGDYTAAVTGATTDGSVLNQILVTARSGGLPDPTGVPASDDDYRWHPPAAAGVEPASREPAWEPAGWSA